MVRLARQHDVVFWEEPLPASGPPSLDLRNEDGVTVATPRIPDGVSSAQSPALQRQLLDEFVEGHFEAAPLLWYYTPMALDFSGHLSGTRVYDCMDELSLFKDAPSGIAERERELMDEVSVVFTGGRSLYYAKRKAHGNVHCFPSAVDAAHFVPQGRDMPAELRETAAPRMGFYGVIDERFDAAFVDELARELGDWNLFFIGPVVKINAASLPARSNIHYLGMRPYEALPAYLEHWDVAILPFALNEATRFISPTKTLEYLAARKPVISTPIADVADSYALRGLVQIARTGREAAAIARKQYATPASRWSNAAVDRVLSGSSWDDTVDRMEELISRLHAMATERAG